MKSVDKLAKRLKDEHDLDVDVSTFGRTRAGYWQRSCGAWSWFMYLKAPEGFSKREIGSQYSVGQLLKAPRLQVGKHDFMTYEVDPLFDQNFICKARLSA
jgi:hypothetical protein